MLRFGKEFPFCAIGYFEVMHDKRLNNIPNKSYYMQAESYTGRLLEKIFK